MVKKNINRFIIIYVVLTILDKIMGATLTEWEMVYNIGMTAFCCLFSDILTLLFAPKPKSED